MKVSGGRTRLQAYPSACHSVRRGSRNSTPHIGGSPGRGQRVGHRRCPRRSREMNFECYLQKNPARSVRENFAASRARSSVLSRGRSGVLSGSAGLGRRTARSPRRSHLGSLVGRFQRSFRRSFRGSSPRSFVRLLPSCQLPARSKQRGGAVQGSTPPLYRPSTLLSRGRSHRPGIYTEQRPAGRI